MQAIGFCPRSGYEYRAEDGYFEVSADGRSWKKVYTITGVPSFGMHTVKLDDAASARYIRYAVPDGAPNNKSNPDSVYCCNIAEIKIYGEAAGSVIGDVTADGKCDHDDAAALELYLISGTAPADWSAGDLDGNGRLNAADLTMLKRLLLK